MNKLEAVDPPQHYGGRDNPYEAIKVIEARWYLDREITNPSAEVDRD